ncbi:MAG: GDSL-type esterase/lipase family protein [Candidatus Moraniibacteriota bacterium]
MKTIIFGLILLSLGIAAGYYFWHTAPVKNVPLRSTGPILFFGDSLVQGVGATVGHDLPALLSHHLGEPVLNYGVAGDTTRQALVRVDTAQAAHPRLVLILLGGNDFLQKVPRDEIFENLRSLITTFQSDGAATVLIGVRSGIIGGGADDRYESLATETDSFYIEDVLQGVFGDPALMSDAIHPNDAGYRKIADRITPDIQSLIHAR